MRYFYNRSKLARRRHRIQVAAQASILAAVVLVWSAAAAGTLNVSVRNGFVTMDAHAVPLGEVLRDLSQKAGFRLVMKKELYAPVTWRLQNVPVEEAINRLLARVSSVALYGPANDGSGSLLTEVRILRGGDNDVPLVEHRDAMAIDHGKLAEGARFDVAMTPSPARNQRASAEDLQPASQNAAPADRGHAPVLPAAKGPSNMAREVLQMALSNPDATVRQSGIQTLIRQGGEESVSSLSRILLEDPAPSVRRTAAAGLGRINTESAFWALMEASSDRDQGVRDAVSAALLRLERWGSNHGAG